MKIINIILILIVMISLISSGCISFKNNDYPKGTILVCFNKNVTIENATILINKYNCSINYIIEPYYSAYDHLMIKVIVPEGKEKEYLKIFEKEPIVYECTLDAWG